MKHPKNWNKMNLSQQESWLIKKLQEVYELEEAIKKDLATVRGGQIIKINDEIDRPDELMLKDA
jgi:NTP pyrophosphatase (non-canonical NTP hydrolase)